MAEVDLKVMKMVERALARTPDLGSSDLFERVKAKHPGVADLSVRQFHARYPLQVKRRQKAAGGEATKKSDGRRSRGRKSAAAKRTGRPRKTRTGGVRKGSRAAPVAEGRTPRDAVRGIMLEFATELASAEAKADVVKVLAGTDQYVDQVISALDS